MLDQNLVYILMGTIMYTTKFILHILYGRLILSQLQALRTTLYECNLFIYIYILYIYCNPIYSYIYRKAIFVLRNLPYNDTVKVFVRIARGVSLCSRFF